MHHFGSQMVPPQIRNGLAEPVALLGVARMLGFVAVGEVRERSTQAHDTFGLCPAQVAQHVVPLVGGDTVAVETGVDLDRDGRGDPDLPGRLDDGREVARRGQAQFDPGLDGGSEIGVGGVQPRQDRRSIPAARSSSASPSVVTPSSRAPAASAARATGTAPWL